MSAVSVSFIATKSSKYQKDHYDQYFLDGKRIIDYILVYNYSNEDPRIKLYLSAIEEIGLEVEEAESVLDSELVFVKVHVPKTILFDYAEKYDIPIKKLQKSYIRTPIPRFEWMRTELTSQNPYSPNYHRAPETFSGDKPTRFLRHERSLVTYNILKRIVYGSNKETDIGIDNLVDNEVFVTSYPLHDGSSLWNNNKDDPLNDRQLLRRFWSKSSNLLKAQPIDVIERYFGDNIALYFDWLAFYSKMLLILIFFGIIVTACNLSYLKTNPVPIEEACNSEIVLCPNCYQCVAEPLRNSCFNYRLAYVTDNNFTIFFAVVMTIWAALYLVLWNRRQAVLALRWNIKDSSLEEQDVRPEFEGFAKNVRQSEFGEPELYIPTFTQCWRKCVSILVCLMIAGILVYVYILLILMEIEIGTSIGDSILAAFISGIITMFSIMILRTVCITMYEPIVIWLVNLEVPQTQTDFDNSYILKIFFFSFINNYTALLYTTFFKGQFYTHPDDPEMYGAELRLTTDKCNPSGCISEIYVAFQILVVFLPWVNYIASFINDKVVSFVRQTKDTSVQAKHGRIPRWEKEYELDDTKPYDILKLYEEMVCTYGFVTLFAFAFPLAPLAALINNLAKTHIDAHNFVENQRRPLGKRTAGVGAWLDIMKFLTLASIVTNAYYITFTSDFIVKQYYQYQKDEYLHGFVNFTLSSYVMNLDHYQNAGIPNGSICFYSGFRNPPGHMRPYMLSFEHYHLLAIRITFILLFEHTIWALTSLLTYSIPSVPAAVREKYAVETMELRRHLASRPSFSSDSIMRLITKKPANKY